MAETRNNRSCTANRRGVALLMVLLIILAITVISTGFLARADVELSCGRNMVLRAQMDQLADSGLEHARGLLLHPQDVASTYWTGTTAQQWSYPGSDYYDVNVIPAPSAPTDRCTYSVTCEAYRLEGAQRIGLSRLSAQFRLDPCIALWAGDDIMHRAGWSCYGDVRCAGLITVVDPGLIDGDVFSAGLTGSATGAHKAPGDLPLIWPPLTASYFNPNYTSSPISTGVLSDTGVAYQLERIWYRDTDLIVRDNVAIRGMLRVNGDLTIEGSGNTITAGKNLPAVYVAGNLIFRSASNIQIDGLVAAGGNVFIGADAANIAITGGLFAEQQVAETAIDSSGNGNDAVIYSQPLWHPAGGKALGALEFDGTADYLQTPDSPARLQVLNDYTLSVWLKPAAVQSNWAGIVSKCSPDGSTNHWSLQFSRYAETLIVCHPGVSWDTTITLAELAADGAWHHVAVVRQGNDMIAYLDGAARLTEEWLYAPGNGDGHLNIGAERTASPAYLYKGLIDDVRVYDGALVQTDVEKLNGMIAIGAAPMGHWKLDETGSQVTVAADPARAAIAIWPNVHWSPAAGGFFKDIRRQ